jgi:phage terminase large subunit-like protein
MRPDSRYSQKRADHAVAFIEQLKHIKTSQWAGKPFTLFPWQETIVRDIFGVLKPDGTRQFRHCFVEVPKKSGKSELAAFILCEATSYVKRAAKPAITADSPPKRFT